MRNFGNGLRAFYGKLTINAVAGSPAMVVNGTNNNYAASFTSPNSGNQSYGLQIVAGTTSVDAALRIQNAAGTNLMYVTGDGGVMAGNIASKGYGTFNAQGGMFVNGNPVLWSNSNNSYSIPAANPGSSSLNVTGANNQYGVTVSGSPVTNGSYGMIIFAGTSAADVPLAVNNLTNTQNFFSVRGDGSVSMSDGFGVQGLRVGYLGMPQSTHQTPDLSDRGKSIIASGTISINNGVFAGGDSFVVYNNNATSVSISGSIATMVLAGTTTTGARTLAPFGIASLYFVSGTRVIVGGNVT